MKKTGKIFLLLVIICTLLVGGMMTANAKLDVQESYNFDTETGELRIKKMSLTDYSLFGVTSTPWYDYRDRIVKIVFDDSVTEVARHAFRAMSVKEVVLGKGITTIGKKAFYNSDLETVTFSDSVKLIEEEAFYGSKLKNVDLNEGVTKIEMRAFSNIQTLESVKLSDSLTTLEGYAFQDCYNLKSVEFGHGSNLTVYSAAFATCYSLSKVDFGYGLIQLNPYAFAACSSLKHVSLPDSLKTISGLVFVNTGLTTAYLGENVSSVDNTSFANCDDLVTITYGKKYTEAGDYVDKDYPNVENLYFLGTEEELEATGSKNLYYPDNIYCNHEHAYTNEVVIIAPTCIESGESFIMCDCGRGNYKITDPTGIHVYDSVIDYTEPSCNSEGFSYKMCDCGAEEMLDIPKDPNNHTAPTRLVDQKDATCYASGYTGDTYCNGCNTKIKTGHTLYPTYDHNYYTFSITKPATCTIPGVRLEKCSNTGCKAERERVIPATGHSFKTRVPESCVPATCANTGIEVYKCHCGKTQEKEVPIDSKNHVDEVEYRNGYAENCGDPGYQGDIYCLGCGSYRGRGMTINPTGNHGSIYIQGDYKENCGNDGYTGNKYCSVCRNLIESGEKIPATGKHNDSNHDGVCNTCGKDSTVSCNHMCHKNTGWYRFCLFFWKLFKMNRYCSCGMAHY